MRLSYHQKTRPCEVGTVLLLISESTGGVNGRAIRFLTRLAHAARTLSDEVYLDRGGRVIPFFVYHSRAISRGAVLGHAEMVEKYALDMSHRATSLCARSLEAAMTLVAPATPATPGLSAA